MSRVLRAMIVDDEGAAREGLRIRLKREPNVEIVGEYSVAEKAVDAIEELAPDVLFLDIEMPGMDGFAVLDRVEREKLPVVVFVTAHSEHAVRAFNARALDYLLKPIEQERLRESLARVRERLDNSSRNEIAAQMRTILKELDRDIRDEFNFATGQTQMQAGTLLNRIPINRDGVIQFVNANHIDWIDAAGDSVILHVGNASHNVRKTMSEIMSMLEPSQFARIHRSTIVNIDRIVELQPYFHGEYVVMLRGGAKLKLSRSYRAAVSRRLGLENA